MQIDSLFRLQPYAHQAAAAAWCENRPYYSLLMEQGTGKTAIVAADAGRRWAREQVDLLIVLAPNGVQLNWVLRELPTHLPEEVSWRAAAWVSDANKREQAALGSMLETAGELRVITANWESLTTPRALDFLLELKRTARKGIMLVGDESQRAKNPKAKSTLALMKHLAPGTAVRAIMSGTPVLNSPWDAFSQFSFLREGLLGTTSYTAFRAEYAELLPHEHGVMRHIEMRLKVKLMERFRGNEKLVKEYMEKYSPQVVARDAMTGLPKWRNLERLDALIAPHAFRVLKKDCLDLPEKIYTQRLFRMTTAQTRIYAQLQEELRLELVNGDLAPVARLAAIQKLSQVVSGYFIVPRSGGTVNEIMPREKNPKLAALREELESCMEARESVIVWARFHEELRAIAAMCAAEKWECVEYHGEVTGKGARTAAIDAFESGAARIFLSQQAAGSTGLTLIAAASKAESMTVIYYSNTFSLGDRVQSEDRAHRIGQSKSVRYVDVVAPGTIDEKVLLALSAKKDVAAVVTGDARRAVEELLNFDRV